MTILELFSGTECISNEFRKRGFDAFTIDWDKSFPSSMHCDIGKLKIEDLPEKFQHPDVVFLAPDCRTYSLAAISKHRMKNKLTGNLDPISEDARTCDTVNQHVLNLLKELNPKVWWIENPRACLQNMSWMQPLNQYKHLITYCQYMTDVPVEDRRMKPTNLWTNIPDPPPTATMQKRRQLPSVLAKRNENGRHTGNQKRKGQGSLSAPISRSDCRYNNRLFT